MDNITLQNKYNELNKQLSKATAELNFAEVESTKLEAELKASKDALLKATGAKTISEVEELLIVIKGVVEADLAKAEALLNGDVSNA